MVDTKKELGGVLITICNYDIYQNPKNYDRTNESTTERTIKEPMKNHPLPNNNKNVKNVKNDKEEIYTEIISHLNQIGSKRYKLTEAVKHNLNARLEEGFTLDDFKYVHTVKWAEWANTDQEQYYRPETLYRASKFQSYLNQRPIQSQIKQDRDIIKGRL